MMLYGLVEWRDVTRWGTPVHWPQAYPFACHVKLIQLRISSDLAWSTSLYLASPGRSPNYPWGQVGIYPVGDKWMIVIDISKGWKSPFKSGETWSWAAEKARLASDTIERIRHFLQEFSLTTRAILPSRTERWWFRGL